MPLEIDIFRSAQQVIKKCGSRYSPQKYAIHMAYRTDSAEGKETWFRIADAVEELTNQMPKGPVH